MGGGYGLRENREINGMKFFESEPVAGMRCPPDLQREDYLPWSRGRGVDVWAMFVAAINGDLETISRLVSRDRALAACEYQYFTPLHFAAREGQLAVVQFLLDCGVNPLYGFGDMPVRMARERGHSAVGDYLEGFLAERYGIVPAGVGLAAAIRDGDLEWVRAAITREPALVHAADERGNRPIHWAALTRELGLIDWLLERGADIEAVRPDGAKAIDLTNGDYHYRSWYRDLPSTALRKHEVVVGFLLARGAYCSISVAAKIGWYQRVLELLDADARLANRLPSYVTYYNGLPLRNAAAAGHMEIVNLLLERGAHVNEPEPGIAPFGGALHSAIGGKHWGIAKLLLEHGADPVATVESSGDILHMARHVGAPAEVISLIESYIVQSGRSRDLDVVAYEGDGSLLSSLLSLDPQAPVDHYLGRLIGEDFRPQLELILSCQPDILRRQTMLSAAWWDGSTFKSAEQARWLLEQGLDPRLGNWLGITMLHRCAAKGLMDIAAVLLEFGASIDAIDAEWSSTPMGWAARHGRLETMEWLAEQGADPMLPADRPWAWPAEWVRKRQAV